MEFQKFVRSSVGCLKITEEKASNASLMPTQASHFKSNSEVTLQQNATRGSRSVPNAMSCCSLMWGTQDRVSTSKCKPA